MSEYHTNPSVKKRPIPAWEATPFVLGGDLYKASFCRDWAATTGSCIRIDKYDPTKDVFYKVALLSSAHFLGCALVSEDGRLIIFTTTDTASAGNQVVACEVNTNTWAWEGAEWVVYTVPVDRKVYNTSATYGPHGYVIALETDDEVPFSIRFISSPDLATWSPIGGLCHGDFYSACPTIRYVENGYYLVSYMWNNGGSFESVMGRTNDFCAIEDFHGRPGLDAYHNLMSPDAGEGTNNSDVDFIEWNGKVYFTYLTGDQSTWCFANDAWFDGTLIDLHRMYWPAPLP